MTATAVKASRETVAVDLPGSTRLAGFAGIGFAASVVVQNIWANAAGLLPELDAKAAEVTEKISANADGIAILGSWMAVNLLLIGLFLAGIHDRVRAGDATFGRLGGIGGLMVMVFFPMANLPLAVLAAGDGLAGSASLVEALWRLHNASFAMAEIGLGMALVGFSIAGVRAGLLPRWLQVVGPIGGVVIYGAGVPLKAAAQGSPTLMFGMAGFLIWLVFLVVAGTRMVREA